MIGKAKSALAVAMLLGVGAAGIPWPAGATTACQGTYTTALLQPLPKTVSVNVEVRDRSPRNLGLMRRFLDGARDTGAKIATKPTVLLHISTQRLGKSESSPGQAAVSGYQELAGMQGGPQMALPDMPSSGFVARTRPPPPPLLFIRVDATPAGSQRIAWSASIQCQLNGSEDQLAEDLGRLVGSTLGERTERRPF